MGNYEFPAHAESLLINLQRFMRDKNLCDIHFNVDGSVFHAHKVVMSSASSYFNAMFNGNMKEQNKREVDISGVKSDIFMLIMEFIYSGKMVVNVNNVQDLLAAANMLSLPDVVGACCSFFKSQLDPSNCLGIRQFAALHSCGQLMADTTTYMHQHFPLVAKEEEFMEVAREELLSILDSEDLCIESEFQVLSAAVEWILHRPRERRKFVVQIFESVRSTLIPPQQLLDYIRGCQDLILRVVLQKLLADHWHPRHRSLKGGQMPPFSLKYRAPLRHRQGSRKHLIYLLGGYCRPPSGRWSDTKTLDSVSCFNALTGAWTEEPSLPCARSGHGAAILDGALYVVGGENDLMIYDSVEIIELAQSKWSRPGPCLTLPRSGSGVTAVDGILYAFGGWVGSEMGSTVERLDPDTNCWSVVTKMPTPRFSFGIAELNGLIYCIGGISEEGTELSSCDCFDPVTEEWLSVAGMGTRRAYVGAAALGGHLYAVGGWNSHHKALSSVEKYSPQHKQWVSVKVMGTSRAGAAVAALNCLLYVMGGRTSCCSSENTAAPFTLDTVEYYDPSNNCWTRADNVPNAMCEGSVAVL